MIRRFGRWSSPLECAAAFLVCLGLMLWIEFAGPAIVDNDGYYHIRWSWMLRHAAPHLPRFEWLPLTVLRAPGYVDHHFLFHVLLTPFTSGDLRVGAKLAAPFFSAVALTVLFALLVAYRVRFRWFWLALLAAGSEQFLYRMSMTRAPSLSLALLAAGVWLILRRRLGLLALLTFAFVWSYSMFPLMVIFAFAYAVTVYLCERRIDLGALWATMIGAALGLVINPYFPRDLILMWQHVRMVGTSTTGVDPGAEWFPFDTWETLTWNVAVCAACFVALLAFDYRKRRDDSKPLFFLMLATLFLVFNLRWSRFVEYWPPFAVLFAAFTLSGAVPEVRGRLHRLGMAALVLATGVALVMNIREARSDVGTETDPTAMRGAAEWVAQHTPAGSLVFNTDWDEFPMLFYYNQRNTYVCGLDPRYLSEANPDLGKLYESIKNGKQEHPGQVIRKRFGAEYVVTDNSKDDFLQAARASGDFDTVYSDPDALVLHVR
jgi:hypothetical protein